jgi:hypothetical protein
MIEATPSVFVIDRSAVGFRVSVSDDELLAGVGSVTPTGAAIDAVFTKLPVAAAATVAVIEKVAPAPTGRSTVVLTLPLPLLAAQDPPAVGTHVHVDPLSVAGIVSMTGAAMTDDGPVLVATTVYVTAVPGTCVAEPSVLVIDRSAVGVKVSVSVAELLAGVGSVAPAGGATVAVLTSVPVADDGIDPATVNVTDAPTGRPTLELMLPLPPTGHVPPPVPAHVHVTALNAAGIESVTVAADTEEGPRLVATMV